MRFFLGKTWVFLLMASLPISSSAQKVKVGYDKSTDFLKFKSYTLTEPSPPPSRPLLYMSIVGSITGELKAKGFVRAEKDGDLILIPAGGMEFGLNMAAGTPIINSYGGAPLTLDATMWTGATGSSNLMAPYVPEGSLILTFVDRSTNKVVWTGTVTEKLDIERKEKSLKLVDKAIIKLLKPFPPTKK